MRIYPVITENTKKLPVYMTGVGVEYKDNINRPFGFREYQISYIEKGKGKFTYGEKTEYLYEGDCFVFRPDIPHKYEYVSKDFCHFWVTYNGTAADSLTDYICIGGTEVFSVENPAEQSKFFEKILKSASVSDKFFDEKCSALIYSYIIKTAENKRNHPLGVKRQRFSAVLEYIENNYSSTITLDELAGVLNLSRYRFCNSFKEVFGMTAMRYLIQYRIQKSKEILLSARESTVMEIAEAVGFNDVSYFCAVFKEYEGVSPLKFRNSQKN